MKKDGFYAITKQNKILEADTWDELLEKALLRKEIKMYIIFHYDKPYITQCGTHYYWPQIKIVNRRKDQKYFQRGKLKIMRVIVYGTYYLHSFRFDLLNCVTHELFSVYYTNSDTFVKEPTINVFYNKLCDMLVAENDKIKQNSSTTI